MLRTWPLTDKCIRTSAEWASLSRFTVLMMARTEELLGRADQYAQRHKLVLSEQIRFGIHGIVFVAGGQSDPGRPAIKVHEREAPYCRDRDVYLRLEGCGVSL